MGAKLSEGRKVVTRDYCGEDRPHFLPSGSTRAVVEATLDQIFRREPQCHQAEGVPAPLLEIPPSITPLVQLPSSVLNVCQIQIPSDTQPIKILEAHKEVFADVRLE